LARSHFEQALASLPDGTREKAATWHNLATIDVNEGHYGPAREKFEKSLRIKQAIGDRAGEAATWHNLATIDVNEGHYGPAREKFEKSLRIKQAIGDRAGEAATWHNLATIDVHEGNYGPAREKFGKALAMRQAIGDRAGEAATFYQLGFLAHRMGRGYAGARLVAICWMIDRAVGHGDTESDFRNLSGICSELGYDQKQFDEMLKEAAAAYQADRGRTLIERAFAAEDGRVAGPE
jgi:tetratricopeptide (TPR) repeat protein